MKQLFTERINRRQMLKVAGGLMLASVFDLRSSPDGHAEMTRMRWVEQDVFPSSGTYQSQVFQAEQRFNSVEVSWLADVPPGADLAVAVRTSVDGDTWSDWHHLHVDRHIEVGPGDHVHAMPHLTEPSGYVQYRIELLASEAGEHPNLREVEIGCVDASPVSRFLSVGGNPNDWVISRAGWGANPELVYDDEGNHRWPASYSPVEKVIIHHTVTQTGGSDPAAIVRAIYYYHAVTLGWGDIGYNYLVDHYGNVYEGRFGGPGVIGGHALSYNDGSMGIAVIGTFDNEGTGQAALDSIVRLIRERASHVDPAGASPFKDRKMLPNICGHRDVNETDCPGDQLHKRLPEIRGWVAGTGPIDSFGSTGPTTGEITDVQMIPEQLHSGATLRVDITVRNRGSNTMYTQGPDPTFIYDEHDDFRTADEHRIEGAYRVGVNFDGNSGLPNPWRWGFANRIDPGESRTVTGFIRLDSVGNWDLSVCLVEELMRYHQNGVFPQRITVLPPPTEPAGQSSDPAMHYFEVTSHNVPDIFYNYWYANGGVARFGYPLTEPIMEMSETDGETYLTQYFERARFEHHPEHAGTDYEVLLGLLGSERTMHRWGEGPFQPVAEPPDTDGVDYFPETGHTLGSVFREFWWANGGVSIYGFPISEEFEEVSQTDGHTYKVQYFERNRFEHHPEFAGTEYEILLGHLAREILIDRGWLEREF